MDRDCPVRSVCFHSQQCIEKYLKAVLTCRSVEFPKMHDIGELLALIPAGLPLSWTPEDQRRITDYATVGRYPGELEGIGIQEAKEAVDCACQVKTAVLALLPDRIARP